jgi:hypothetical protein
MRGGKIAYFGETSRGVSEYEKEMDNLQNKGCGENSKKDCCETAGTGRIKIVNVSFLKNDKTTASIARNGDNLCLAIDYFCSQEQPVEISLEVTMRDHEGELCRYSSKVPDQVGLHGRKTGRVIWTFLNIPINTPRLDFSVSIWSPDFSELYDWRKNLIILSERVANSTGRAHLQSKIEHIYY